jgi:GTP 3',8-cyclase
MKYIFDGHKLAYHTERVSEFLKNGDCFPLYMEISPVGSCNHRCIFCAYDFIGHPNQRLKTGLLKRFIAHASKHGVKSMLFAGEGEPLLHPDIADIIGFTRSCGIDVGLFTNGELFTKASIEEIVPNLTFLRFSFNAGRPKDYAKIHQTRPHVFEKVVSNLKAIAAYKAKHRSMCDIGVQFVLLPENQKGLLSGIKAIREAGADYFVIKPFVLQDKRQAYQQKKIISNARLIKIFDAAESLGSERFKVIARRESFEKYGMRKYTHCLGTSFISVLNSAGDIATCLPYWDKQRFIFGNIYRSTFKEIWKSARRQYTLSYLKEKLDTKRCPPNCRPHAINEYLWEITHPTVKHVNFI